ncbi:FAD-dependent protein [Desulfuromonas sp. AOP6]|uniref:NAD(P)/FAD-dependent oxidoreductase n=1 Tax=Desulfuromonas sp. AOP6 TaxID=1566351 RepID=UPI001286BC8C|nr:NAD(P)/FAD-dependent oxidoreductase [Desulfuromonas sp. AOP6]BCA79573.1 hypothetical protein AOP6_1360 [Desulfuromonas sp. AOP6]
MPLRLRDLPLTLEQDESLLPSLVEKELGLNDGEVHDLRVVRQGIDARKKPRVLRIYTVEFRVKNEAAVWKRTRNHPRLEQVSPQPCYEAQPLALPGRILVVGMGPAGLFAALRLAQYGFSVMLLERGRPVEERVRDVRDFWAGKGLCPESNVQFGEGGAGTFSDGKLTTRVNHPWTRLVLETLVRFGAPADILIQAKPHVGTDRLRLVLIHFRQELLRLGVDIRYQTKLTDVLTHKGHVCGAVLGDGLTAACDALVLAPGHSARDTYEMLASVGVRMQAKPFAVGVRVEHPSERINNIQYGFPTHPRLPAAEYALSYNNPESGRGTYSFCMCPGGEVVVASSEEEGVVVNGMSYLSRSGPFSNSALVVSVRPEDFPGDDCLAGMRFQRELEKKAFLAGGADYNAPAQSLMDFMGQGKPSLPPVSSCRPGIQQVDLEALLPAFVTSELREALPVFQRRMKGFVCPEAVLIGLETRTSAPLRILRGEDGQSLSHPGLYPAGEGAGYAGGIMSAALDGLKVAEYIAQKVKDVHGTV